MAAMRGIADNLSEFTAETIWSSPARRCVVLADAIAGGRRWTRKDDVRLMELNFGDWEGQSWDSVPRGALDAWAADPLVFAPPGGEMGAALIQRVRSFHADLVAQRRDCVVVSHGGPLKLLAALLRDQEPDLLAPAPGFGQVDIVAC